MIQSPSSIGTFKTCPRQYEAKYITKEVVFMPTEHTIYGTRVHNALEVAIKGKQALDEEFSHLQPVVNACNDMPGTKYAETKYAVMVDGSYTHYSDKTALVRCIVDLVVIDGDVAMVIDWKTGKVKADDLQLRINVVCIFAAFPRVNTVKTAFAYTKTGDLQAYKHDRKNTLEMLASITHDIEGVRQAEENNQFKPTPSGLCKAWCDVTACKYNGKKS